MKLIAEVKNCKANNDTIVSMISNAVINHHFGVVDFKGAQKDAIIKYYIFRISISGRLNHIKRSLFLEFLYFNICR